MPALPVLRRPLRRPAAPAAIGGELFVRTLQALGATSLILALLYAWFPALIVGRGVFVVAAIIVRAA